MDSRHRMSFVVGIVCAFAVCSSHAASAEAPGAPCALLTPAQVSAVLGVPVGAGQPIGTTGCQWSTTTEANPTSPKVMATVSLWDGGRWAEMKVPLPNVTKTSVSGVGEDAMWATVGPFTTLSVKKGSVAFVFKVYGVKGQDKQMAMEKALALDLLAAL